MQFFFDRIDTNGDGALDKAEIEASRQRRGSGGGRGSGGPRDLMQMDANGDGKVTKEEVPEGMRDFFDRIDANGDGAIDRAEADEMRKRFSAGGGGPPGGP
jgi:collagen type III alpha